MVYTKEAKSVEVIKEGSDEIIKLNYEAVSHSPSIEENPLVMMDAIDRLVENPSASRITFSQRRNYNYSYDQTQMLIDFAQIYSYYVKSKKATSLQNLGLSTDPPEVLGQRLEGLRYILFNLLKTDPLASYVELKRLARTQQILFKNVRLQEQTSLQIYINLINEILERFERAKLVIQSKEYLPGYTGDREIYKLFFKPTITPNFMYSRLMTSPPIGGTQLDIYKTNPNTEVTIFDQVDDIKKLYQINPPEFKISEDKYQLLDLAKKVLEEHQPRDEEFLEPAKLRKTFTNIGKDMLRELAEQKGMLLSPEEIDELAEILVRNTIGFGLIELLLEDPKVQDLTINSPMGQVPIFLLHDDYHECITNITPTKSDFESWATKLRLLSGRPLDEANPILDTEVIFPKARSRLSIIGKPLNPYGYGMAFRRHRDTPWTLPLFIKNNMISALGAGLLSFTIHGSRTHLVAGTRSSGKCLKGDTIIQLANGNQAEIKDLVEQNLNKQFLECDDGVYSFTDNITILTTDDKLKIIPKDVTCVWKRTAPEYLYEIKLRSGKTITTTPEHPVLAMSSNFFGYKRTDKINPNMRIGTARNIQIHSNHNFKIDVNEKEFKIRTNAKKIRIPQELTKDLVALVGYILADGHVFNGGIQFINCNKELRNHFNSLLFKEFNIKAKLKIDKRNNVSFLEAHSKNLVRYLNKVFKIPIGKKAGKIFLTDSILGLPDDYLSPLLKAMFDSDGYVAKDHREIEYSTKSKLLASQLQLILSRFGIVSFKKFKIIDDTKYYSLFINGKDCNIFEENIGFTHPDKQNRLNYFIKQNFQENTNADSIPYGNHIVKELRNKLRIRPFEQRIVTGKDYWAYENNEYNISSYWFRKLIVFYNQRYEELKELNLKELYNFYEILDARQDFLNNIKELRNILGISQSELGKDYNLLNEKNFTKDDLKYLPSLFSLVDTFPTFQDKVLGFMNPNLENIQKFTKDVNLSYAKIASDVNCSESHISHCRKLSLNKLNPKLSEYFTDFRTNKLKELQNRIIPSYHRMLKYKSLINQIDVSRCLSQLQNLRKTLNLKNEEYSINAASVTNFFNNKYGQTCIKTLHNLTKKTLDTFESTTSEEVQDLLNLGKSLCSEDLFWDEVVEVRKIKTKEKWVYDLTVEPTHNFIANGIIAHNTSFLGATLLEIMRKHRILTIEDTLELPTESMRKLGYNVQPLKVRAALSKGGSEVPADEGIRTSLRLGDSALIVGEVRSTEAIALYEAMRIGASANVVAGTIHGDSPYGIFDRVVNDLGVPRTSFKATDIIVMAAPIQSASGLHKVRRIVSITEVRKTWEEDPLAEGGFVDLMLYNAKTDKLEPTADLLNGESEVLKAIGGNVKEWAGNWDAIWENIVLRGELKQMLVDYSIKVNMPNLLEAEFSLTGNDMLYRFTDQVVQDTGSIDTKMIKEKWEAWLRQEIQNKINLGKS